MAKEISKPNYPKQSGLIESEFKLFFSNALSNADQANKHLKNV